LRKISKSKSNKKAFIVFKSDKPLTVPKKFVLLTELYMNLFSLFNFFKAKLEKGKEG